eukprot:4199138-Prymnesium_polylepis.1
MREITSRSCCTPFGTRRVESGCVCVCVTRLTWGRCRVSGHSRPPHDLKGEFPRHRTAALFREAWD